MDHFFPSHLSRIFSVSPSCSSPSFIPGLFSTAHFPHLYRTVFCTWWLSSPSLQLLFWNYCSNISSSRAQTFLPSFVSFVLFATPKFKSLFHFHFLHFFHDCFFSFLFFLPPTANTSHCPQVQEVMLQQPVPGSLLPAAGACSRCSASCWSVINSARTHLSQFSSRFCGCGYHPLHRFSLVLRYMGGDPPKCL